MISSSSFKSKLGKSLFIETISYMLEKCESVKGQTMDEFRRALFLIIEALAKHNKILVN